MSKYLNQVYPSQTLASCIWNVLTLLDFWWRGCDPLFCPRFRGVRSNFAPCLYIVFQLQSSIGTCQNLEGCVAFRVQTRRKPPKRMHRRCSRHYVCMLWHSQCLPMKLFVSADFHEIQWQEDCLCHVTMRKSSIQLNWVWSPIFTENQS